MNNKLYKLMNWPQIEEIIYSDGCNPHRILGAHKVGTSLLVQCFRPDAAKVDVVVDGTDKRYEMELADEAGFYAALIPFSKENKNYHYEITKKDKTVEQAADPYVFAPVLDREDAIKLSSGIHYSAYRKLGAHPMKIDGVQGVHFAVWAPGASRVSVIGDFNGMDGRLHQMKALDDSGIFALFLPELAEGTCYQYEVKSKEGFVFVKNDPYATKYDPESGRSVVREFKGFRYRDDEWMEKRRKLDKHKEPLSICEISLDRFASDHGTSDFKKLGPALAAFLKGSGFNAVELMPVMEHLAHDPFAVTGYFAVTGRFGEPEGFASVVNALHGEGLRVFMDFPATFFPEENTALRQFTGSALYEYGDSRGLRPGSPYIVFDYGRREVQNYLLTAALYWLDLFHLDGLRLPDISKILYLDYDKQPGEWLPNIYGGNENLEAEEFIRHLNDVVFKKDPGIYMLCKETACYPQVTGALRDGGLGFDYKWNNGWSRDFFGYMRMDPLFRASHHGDLTFSMIYHYSERFILAFSHEDIGGMTPMLDMMPGDETMKAANARFALAYLMLHPGRKMVYRGVCELTEAQDRNLETFMHDLNALYFGNPALYELDDAPEGFQWINAMAAEACYMSYVRAAKKKDAFLLVVANMAGIGRRIPVGVPQEGKYTEIMNTDRKEYGGSGVKNDASVIEAFEKECDGRDFRIEVEMAPASVAVFSFRPYTEAEKKIRKIKNELLHAMEAEQVSAHDKLVEDQKREEERLLAELRVRYEKEIADLNRAIYEKYHRIEEERIALVAGTRVKKETKKDTKKNAGTDGSDN